LPPEPRIVWAVLWWSCGSACVAVSRAAVDDHEIPGLGPVTIT
jgi:hypothetical protein